MPVIGVIQPVKVVLAAANTNLNGFGRIYNPFISCEPKRCAMVKFRSIEFCPGIGMRIDMN